MEENKPIKRLLTSYGTIYYNHTPYFVSRELEEKTELTIKLEAMEAITSDGRIYTLSTTIPEIAVIEQKVFPMRALPILDLAEKITELAIDHQEKETLLKDLFALEEKAIEFLTK